MSEMNLSYKNRWPTQTTIKIQESSKRQYTVTIKITVINKKRKLPQNYTHPSSPSFIECAVHTSELLSATFYDHMSYTFLARQRTHTCRDVFKPCLCFITDALGP